MANENVEIPMASTPDEDVLYGCRFTLPQIKAMAEGVVPPEVQAFFVKAYAHFTSPDIVEPAKLF